jgi:hypothetical protein
MNGRPEWFRPNPPQPERRGTFDTHAIANPATNQSGASRTQALLTGSGTSA